ncbi:MAG: hypothetical protein KJ583_06185 [Nanoarchaeota archaeon]|nr:hypothetical protein [Nanoarchaeota archaeon]MBU1269819.1 hypothetical protein [Nanoarchaeota archaeon]MBU1604874.1 hypothetical protein [Nanoarchaeota archaeon]MBU2443151.1 hypothetical protein [Nanoarchaeota archaeon]
MNLKTLLATLILSTTQIVAPNNLENKIIATNNHEVVIDEEKTKYPSSKNNYTNQELSVLKIPHQSNIKQNKILIMYADDEQTSTDEFKKVKRKQLAESKKYDQLLNRIEQDRQTFQEIYKSASKEQKPKVIKNARKYLEETLLQEIFPTWIGTEWNFYGATTNPLEGSIACGYFVSTTLEDVGLNLNSVRLAQHPSENIIKYLSGNEYIRLSNHQSMEKANKKLEEKFKDKADGLYVIGLDCHTGFLYKKGDHIDFIHSTYINPWSVTWEDGYTSTPIVTSGYKVIGKLFTDKLVEKWIEKERTEVKKWGS